MRNWIKAFKLENGLLKLISKREEKRETGDWEDHLMIKESNSLYECNE